MIDKKRAQNAPNQEQNKGSENLSNEQASVKNFDLLRKIESGDYLNRVGSLEYAPANDILMAASLEPVPQSLWGEGLIFENEVTCLYSDSGTGKSILSVQLGNDIALAGRRVLYVDFELSDVQFYKRYRNDSGETYAFADTFYRADAAISKTSSPPAMTSACFRMKPFSGLPLSVADRTYLFSFEKFFATMVNVLRFPVPCSLLPVPCSLSPKRSVTFGTCGAPMM